METELRNILTEIYRGQKENNDEAVERILLLFGVSNSWLSPIDSEKEWQEKHIQKIWQGYPNICPNWQILNGLIRFSCDNLDIEVTEP